MQQAVLPCCMHCCPGESAAFVSGSSLGHYIFLKEERCAIESLAEMMSDCCIKEAADRLTYGADREAALAVLITDQVHLRQGLLGKVQGLLCQVEEGVARSFRRPCSHGVPRCCCIRAAAALLLPVC